jgi:hypothetical protein
MLSTSVPFVPIQYQSSSLAEFCLVKERDFARAVDMFERWGCETLKGETCMIGVTTDPAHTDVFRSGCVRDPSTALEWTASFSQDGYESISMEASLDGPIFSVGSENDVGRDRSHSAASLVKDDWLSSRNSYVGSLVL